MFCDDLVDELTSLVSSDELITRITIVSLGANDVVKSVLFSLTSIWVILSEDVSLGGRK